MQEICWYSQSSDLSKLLSRQKLAILVILFLFSAATSHKDGDVKLVNGPTKHQGTVAVYYQNAWGTICDDGWSWSDANIICKQMGYERARYIWYRARYGPGPGRILIDNIECPSSADHILQCTPNISRWGIHNCGHDEDAGVDCIRKEPAYKPQTMPVKLLCPEFLQGGSCKNCSNKIRVSPGECSNQTAVEGVVFAYYNNAWNPVSGDGFGEEAAKIVCGELGYSLSFPSPSLSTLWRNWDGWYLQSCSNKTEVGSGQEESDLLTPSCSDEEVASNDRFRKRLNRMLLGGLECTGSEQRLLDCYFPEFGPHSGSGLNVATVRCGFKPHPSCNEDCKDSTCQSKEEYRLRGGLYPWSGRLEVRTRNGRWATVRYHGWDAAEANIVCRSLGYGGVKTVLSASYGRGVGDIIYSDLKCKGDEPTLADCKDKTTGYYAGVYGHRFDVGLECAVPETCDEGADGWAKLISRRISRWPYDPNDFVSVKGPQGWGMMCSNSLKARAANVVCRSTRDMFGARVRAEYMPGETGVLYSGSINCTGAEMSISECNMSLTRENKCEENIAVVDCTQGLPDLVPDLPTLSGSVYYYPYINPYPMYLLNCAVEEKCVSSSAYGASSNDVRFLLRFSSLTMNYGTVDFQPNLRPDQWQYHSCHRHFHSFEAFIHYDLLHEDTGVKAAEGHKASFCLEDSTCEVGGSYRYRCSGSQGISPNCGDRYGSHLDCQWIDVTDVGPGNYILRLLVNPDYLISESDYDNNEITCQVELLDRGQYRQLTTKSCQLSDH